MLIRLLAAGAALLIVPAAFVSAQSGAPAGPITLDVQYTPGAARIVARTHYPMQANMTFMGDPVPAHAGDADEMTGAIDLGMSRQPIPATAGRHAVPLTGLNRAHLSWVREAKVSIDVSPRLTPAQVNHSTVANTIICEGPSGISLASARSAPVPIICRTMSETH